MFGLVGAVIPVSGVAAELVRIVQPETPAFGS
jgi:hypothetical protein